jgi:hypothetical protein
VPYDVCGGNPPGSPAGIPHGVAKVRNAIEIAATGTQGENE